MRIRADEQEKEDKQEGRTAKEDEEAQERGTRMSGSEWRGVLAKQTAWLLLTSEGYQSIPP